VYVVDKWRAFIEAQQERREKLRIKKEIEFQLKNEIVGRFKKS